MAVKTYKATVRIKSPSGGGTITQQVTVQADSTFNAKVMLETQYGKGSVISGISEVR